MNTIESLTQLGLTEREATLYIELLRLGGASATDAAKAVGVKRTTVYPILRAMAKKGFVTQYMRNGKRVYHAQRPRRLASVFEKRLNRFEESIISLEQMDKRAADTFGLRFLETKEELKQFFDSVIVEYAGKKYCAIGDTPAWEAIDPDVLRSFRTQRAKNGIDVRLLLTATSQESSPDDDTLLREVRYLPKQYVFKSSIDIYPDKILIISPELAAAAVVVEVPAMTDVFQAMFDMLWNTME
jgi:sugar-specific transcriptional regulator TrmB